MMKRRGSANNLLENLNSLLSKKDPTGITDAVGSGINTIGAVGVSSMNTIGAVGASGINTISNMSAHSIHSLSSTISTTKPKHKASSGPTTELSLEELEDFLQDTLSEELDSTALVSLYQALEMEKIRDILNELEQALQGLLKSHPALPPKITANLHTYLGLVYMELGNNNSAVDALMRAIWFQSRTPEDTFAIAQANHRLGMAYGRKKDYEQATELIDRAIAGYDTSSDNYVMAKEDRHDIVEAQQLELLTKNGRYTIRQDMQQTVARNQRVARRRRGSATREKPKHRSSFSGLAEVFNSIGGGGNKSGPGLERQETAPVATKSSRHNGPGLKRSGSDPLSLASRSPS
jgi:tetratricopeptide (TPR) repeat protein